MMLLWWICAFFSLDSGYLLFESNCERVFGSGDSDLMLFGSYFIIKNQLT